MSSRDLGNLGTEQWGARSKLEKRKVQKQMGLLWRGLGKAAGKTGTLQVQGGEGRPQALPRRIKVVI